MKISILLIFVLSIYNGKVNSRPNSNIIFPIVDERTNLKSYYQPLRSSQQQQPAPVPAIYNTAKNNDNSKSDTADDDDAKLMTILSNPPDEIELPSDAEGDLITNNNNDAEEGSSLAKELFILQAEIDRLEETGEPIPENERPKRTLRYISRLFCSVLRSIVPFCASTTTTSAPPTNGEGGSGDEDDDNFWLDYLNSNTTTTTTTPRPAFGTLAWKRQQLARFFPRLFGWLGRSGGGSGDGSFLLNLLSAPLRAFRRLNLGGLLGGRGGANSGS